MELTAGEKKLHDIFMEAENMIENSIVLKALSGNQSQYLVAMIREVRDILDILDIKAISWVEDEIPKAYRKGLTETNAFYTRAVESFGGKLEGSDLYRTDYESKLLSSVIKKYQLDLINETNPSPDDIHTWITKIDDIQTFEEALNSAGYKKGEKLSPDYGEDIIETARKSGKITVYSSKPIEAGNFISPSKMEAESYAGDGKVYSKEVDIKDVAWIDGFEGQYAPVAELVEKYSGYPREFSTIHREALNVLINKTTLKISETINGAGRIAEGSIREAGQEAITTKLATGSTLRKTQQILKEKLNSMNLPFIPRKDGSKMSLEAYAKLVARSTTREATNLASVNQTLEVGDDLVHMSEHSPTCPICLPLQGRVYSITGKTKGYPPLSKAWTGPYANIHPNCKHVFNPYILEFKTEQEIKDDQEFSNRPFDMDEWSKKERTKAQITLDVYNEQQKKLAKKWRNKKQYENYKAALGADSVPKSFSGFMRMKNSNNQNWKDLQGAYRTKGQLVKHMNQPYILSTWGGQIRGFADEESMLQWKKDYKRGTTAGIYEYEGDSYRSQVKRGLMEQPKSVLATPNYSQAQIDDTTELKVRSELTSTVIAISEDGKIRGFKNITEFDKFHIAYHERTGAYLKSYTSEQKLELEKKGFTIKPRGMLDITDEAPTEKINVVINNNPQVIKKNNPKAPLANQASELTVTGEQIIQAAKSDLGDLPLAPNEEIQKLQDEYKAKYTEMELAEDNFIKVEKEYEEKKEALRKVKEALESDENTLKRITEKYKNLYVIPDPREVTRPHYETIDEAERAFLKMFPIPSTSQRLAAPFTDMTLEQAQNFMNAAEEMKYVFGELPPLESVSDMKYFFNEIKKKSTPQKTWAYYHPSEKMISVRTYAPDHYERIVKAHNDGWWTADAKDGTEAHELGHAYHYLQFDYSNQKDRETLGQLEDLYDTEIRYKTLEEQIKILSEYGATNHKEMIAEAVCDVITNSEPKEFSKKVFFILTQADSKASNMLGAMKALEDEIDKFEKQIEDLRKQIDPHDVGEARRQRDILYTETQDAKKLYDDAMAFLTTKKMTLDEISNFDYGAYKNSSIKDNAVFKEWYDTATEVVKNLTSAERESVAQYTSSYYRYVNRNLRGDQTNRDVNESVQTMITNLKKVVADGAPLPENTVFYRGTSGGGSVDVTQQVFGSFNQVQKILKDINSGAVKEMALTSMARGRMIVDHGFMSTSYGSTSYPSALIQYVIYADKGDQVGQLIQPLSRYESEREILLKPGQVMTVLKVEYINSTKLIVHLKIN